ncbi:hypothetical protein DFH06DRAFT_1313945 [Mycena polygramma]|nr:hypothetical protein DFH06DRAFT_1313945 [Mycena polygramma]
MSLLALVPELGPLSNREAEFQTQNILAIDENVRSSSCLEILRNSPNLWDGTFSFARDSSDLPSSDILEHNHLQRLDLSSTEHIRAPLLVLNCLKIPGLKSLELEFPNLNHPAILPADISPFLSFVSRSCCELHTLTLLYLRTTPDDLVECLKATSSLVCLRLSLSPDVPMDAVLAQSTGQVNFLPKLESLHIFFPQNYASRLDVSVVVQMLCWRWDAAGIGRLNSFRLGYHKELQFAEALTSYPEWEALQAEGMDLYFGQTSHLISLAYQ